jgi:DNA-binding PadR family transcriptional regulator
VSSLALSGVRIFADGYTETVMRAPKRQHPQSPLALAVLALLLERPMHPYEMAATMRERHKEESIKLRYGSLYSVAGLLQREGLIAPQETSRDGRRPERTVYAITEAGRAELTAWMSDLLRRPVKEYPQFMAALSLLPVLPPDAVSALLTERLQHLDLAIQTRRGALVGVLQSGVPPLFLIEGDYELALMEAERRFVHEFIARIAGNPADLAPIWPEFHAETFRRRRKP